MTPEQDPARAARVAAYAAQYCKRYGITVDPCSLGTSRESAPVVSTNKSTYRAIQKEFLPSKKAPNLMESAHSPSPVLKLEDDVTDNHTLGTESTRNTEYSMNLMGGVAKEAKRLSIEPTRKRSRAESPVDESREAPTASPLQFKPPMDAPSPGATGNKSESTAKPLPVLCSKARSGPRTPPKWYTEIVLERINWKKSSKHGSREVITRLSQIGTLIRAAKETHGRPDFERIREEIHWLEFIPVTTELLRKVDLLDNQRGLPQLFDNEYKDDLQVPWDIEADASELYNKWVQMQFDPDLLRGIITQPGTNDKCVRKKSWSFDPNAERISALYFGNGFLVNGQWWPRQICAVRDGAHGAPIAGITGIRNKGAVSVVMSGSVYHDQDQDNGEVVWYCGTESNEPSGPSDATRLLMLSLENRKPVRLMRSANIPNSRYKPSHGFRYDGLYDIVEKELINEAKYHYRFRLIRQPGQDPIRYQGVEARPTIQEIIKLQSLERILGMRGGFN